MSKKDAGYFHLSLCSFEMSNSLVAVVGDDEVLGGAGDAVVMLEEAERASRRHQVLHEQRLGEALDPQLPLLRHCEREQDLRSPAKKGRTWDSGDRNCNASYR